MPSDAFITMLCDETGFENIVRSMPGGEGRLANLRLLEQYAAEYEAYGYNGISGFVRFIDRLKKNRSDMESANVVSENADVVRIMSIHKSKGLEFPVCIVAGCGRRFVPEYDDMRLHPTLGLGIRLTDPETGARYTTLPREAIAIASADSAAAEELRVFYVAMTRAKEKLILLSTVKSLDTTLARLSSQITQEPCIAPYAVGSASSISEWLMLCALRHPDGEALRSRIGADSDCILRAHYTPWTVDVVYPPAPAEKREEAAAQPAPVDPALRAEIERAIDFVYPYAAQTAVPTKVSASGLAAVQAESARETTLSRPAFLGAKGMTPAERGTALHDFMQFSDFTAAAADPGAELERLVREKFLTAEQAQAVDLRRVRRFFNSPLGRRVLKAERVYKEQRFIAQVPAKLVNDALEGEDAALPVILQGAVDCMFEEDGKGCTSSISRPTAARTRRSSGRATARSSCCTARRCPACSKSRSPRACCIRSGSASRFCPRTSRAALRKKLIFPLTKGNARSIIIQETKRSRALTPVQYCLTQVNIAANAERRFQRS